MTRDRPDVVAIVQPFVPGYRRPLFDAMGVELRRHGLRLEVWHDYPKGRVAARGNADSGEWSVPIKQHRISIGRRNLTFRNIKTDARRVRVVIAGLASTNLETYLLALDPRVRLMLWGHGRNFTASNNSLDTKIENWLSRRASHIFSYTAEGKDFIVGQGIDPQKVTVVVNTTDTGQLIREQQQATGDQIEEFRRRLSLGDSRVALFIGAFDKPKELPFLFEAMDIVVKRHPNIVLVLAGAGPDEGAVRAMASTRPYVRLAGRMESTDFARFSRLVDIVVMPGRVGLVAVDALALGLPIATTNYPFHAPEASYLQDGVDSVWSDFEVAAYAATVGGMLGDTSRLATLAADAATKGRTYSVEASAARFVSGIIRGLED